MTLGSIGEIEQLFKYAESTLRKKKWRFLGRSSRYVWLSPSKVVYKYGEDCQNEEELKNYQRIKDKGIRLDGWYIPQVSSHYYEHYDQMLVIAMEYVSGPTVAKKYKLHKCTTFEEEDILENQIYNRDTVSVIFGLGDLHSQNVIAMEDGRFAAIDLGFSY